MTPIPRSITLALIVLAAPVLAGCIGNEDAVGSQSTDPADAVGATASWARELPETITGLETLTSVGPDEGLDSGYQITLEGDIAYVAAWNAGFYTLNVSNPEAPTVLGHVGEHFGHDVDLLHYEDGRTVAAVAGSGDGIALIDVTDPRTPTILSTILGQEGTTDIDGANVHNLRVVPGTHTIYNSRSVDTPGADIVDASDPENPELVDVFSDVTCHDIGFWIEGDRAYCAGVRETQIWDIAEPQQPELVTRIVNPAISIHHWAIPAQDGSLLLIGDEFLGATGPYANACHGGVDNPLTGGTTTDPIGALWFYDISNEDQPTPISYVGAGELHDAPEACTAHFGEIVPDRDKLVLGFLAGGTYLIDFTDVQNPAVIDHLDQGGTPDVRIHNGYAFGVGRDRGMDVMTFTGE